MAKVKDSKDKSVKLYKKVRNTSSWGSIVAYLLLIILFIMMLVFIAGYVLEYIFESKFAEGYNQISNVAGLYEYANGEKNIMDHIESGDTQFIVKDKSGNIVYQNGENTCGDKSGDIELSNGKETYTVYADKELGLIYPNKDKGLDVKWKKLFKWMEDHEDNISLPVWISIGINNGEQEFIGKAYITINKRDVVLAVELMSGMLIVVAILIILMFVKIIKSAVNYRRIVKLFYYDPTTEGHNWMWYVRYGNDRLQSSFSKKDSFAVINLVFKNYRNYCLCHSVAEGERLLAKINKMLNAEMNKGEMCAHATMSNFALLLKYDGQHPLKPRLESIIKMLQDIDSEHNFDFQIGADLVPPKTNESGKVVKRKDASIENAYNNACAARAALGDSQESGIRIFDSKLLEEQRWYDTVHENQWTALNNEEFVVYYQPKYESIAQKLNTSETVLSLCKLHYKNFVPQGHDSYQYIELADVGQSGDISDVDIQYGSDLPTRARRIVKSGQIIVSSVEGSLQSCALITDEYDGALCSTGFYVLDSDCINSETLLVLFKSEPIQALMKQRCSGTILTAISKDELLSMPLPMIDEDVQKAIAAKVQESVSLRRQSKQLLEYAKQAVEMAIEQGEDTALEWLKDKED